MKKLIFYSIILASLAGCSNKYESLKDIDLAPVIGLSSDTLYVRLNDTTTNAGRLEVLTADANGDLLQVKFADTSNGKVSVYYDQQPVTNGLLPIIGDSTRVWLVAHDPGTYAIPFTLVDRFGKTDSQTLIVQTLDSTLPTARFSVAEDSSTAYVIDGSASSDPFGFIIQYHYSVDGYDIYSPDPIIHQVFYQPGAHNISLTVENDVRQFSQPFSLTINTQ
jgi:hypothetical protein